MLSGLFNLIAKIILAFEPNAADDLFWIGKFF